MNLKGLRIVPSDDLEEKSYYFANEVGQNHRREIVQLRDNEIWTVGSEYGIARKYYENFIGPIVEPKGKVK